MWFDVTGRNDKQAIVRAMATGKTVSGESVLMYTEMEAALVQALTAAGTISTLNEWC